MHSIKIETSFSAAHNLRQYKGKCEALHGHNWKVEAVLASETLNKGGMVMDFHDVKKIVKSILAPFDHAYLNKLPYFKKVNPTSEHISAYIYRSLKKKLPQLTSVTIWENTSCSATYEE
jgi:6-pyruvoyltetrahydropterin/6-carboxytetrahydropterin synthase